MDQLHFKELRVIFESQWRLVLMSFLPRQLIPQTYLIRESPLFNNFSVGYPVNGGFVDCDFVSCGVNAVKIPLMSARRFIPGYYLVTFGNHVDNFLCPVRERFFVIGFVKDTGPEFCFKTFYLFLK